MASNGLDTGDTIKADDTFLFFRGERAELSPGRRFVRFSELATYLNDTSVLTAFA